MQLPKDCDLGDAGKKLLDVAAIKHMLEDPRRNRCCKSECLDHFKGHEGIVANLRRPHAYLNREGRRAAIASYGSIRTHAERELAGLRTAPYQIRQSVEGVEVCMVAFKRLFGISKDLWQHVLHDINQSLTERGHNVCLILQQ